MFTFYNEEDEEEEEKEEEEEEEEEEDDDDEEEKDEEKEFQPPARKKTKRSTSTSTAKRKTKRSCDSTHEVAKTPPNHVMGTSWSGEYEKCIIVGETKTTYDVKITSDGAVCQNVLKMYEKQK